MSRKEKIIVIIVFAAIFAWLFFLLDMAHAGYVYPFRIISGNTTGEVDETQFSASDITLSLTNLPGGGRRAIIGIIGVGGGGSSNNTVIVASPSIDIIDEGDGTNELVVSNSTVTAGSYGDSTHVATFTVGADGRLTLAGTAVISASGGNGVTNVLDTAGGPYDLVGHTNQPTLLIKGLSNATPATLTITDFGTFIAFTVASQGGFGSTNAWTTNGLPWSVSDTFGFSNASSVVSLAFTNLGGVPTIYLVPDSTIARTGNSTTWSAPQTFNSSATLTLGAPTWFKASVTVSDSVAIVSNATVGGSLTVAGNATITGNVNAGSFTGSMDGGNITGNQTVGTNTLAAFGSNTGTIGSAGQFLVVHLNSAGIPDGWSTVTGSSLATSTNSISAVQLGGSWNNGVIAWSATNFSVATINGTTVTVGFASLPFENLTVLNGTTNFTLHGSSLTISNLLAAVGITLTNRGNGQIDLGGTVSMLSNAANNFITLTGSSSTPTQQWAGTTSWPVIQMPSAGNGTIKFQSTGSINGFTATWTLTTQDGSNVGYLRLVRDNPKNAFEGITFNNSTSGTFSIGQEPTGNATGDKACINISSTSANLGGLIVANADGNDAGLSGYQFYENDPRFPRILFTNNKQTTDTNTPSAHETYASFGNWTANSVPLQGGAFIVIGSNENWLVACGRGLGSVSGTKAKEYPTNSVSGFLAAGVTSAQSNQTFVVIRDQTNGVWCLGVDTNGVLGAYRTNDLSTTVTTY